MLLRMVANKLLSKKMLFLLDFIDSIVPLLCFFFQRWPLPFLWITRVRVKTCRHRSIIAIFNFLLFVNWTPTPGQTSFDFPSGGAVSVNVRESSADP